MDGASAQRWLPPEQGAPGGRPVTMASPQEKEVERGYEDGHAKGYEDGKRAAAAEMQAHSDRLCALLRGAVRPFEHLDEKVEEELCRLCIVIARQVIRRELHSDPDQVAGLIRESLKLIGNVTGQLRIRVHPDDAAVVRRMFADDQDLSTVTVEEDPSISRGGCTLATNVSFIDATVESRIARMAVQLLGDERGLEEAEERARGRDDAPALEVIDDADTDTDAGKFDMVLS